MYGDENYGAEDCEYDDEVQERRDMHDFLFQNKALDDKYSE